MGEALRANKTLPGKLVIHAVKSYNVDMTYFSWLSDSGSLSTFCVIEFVVNKGKG